LAEQVAARLLELLNEFTMEVHQSRVRGCSRTGWSI
jgi:hypothetical protein